MIYSEPSISISQLEHARVAASLLEHFNDFQQLPLADQHILKTACLHHDDGWRKWEAHPKIDPRTNFPLDFQCISCEDHINIWQDSNAIALKISPEVGFLVCQHSLYLSKLRFTNTENTSHHKAIQAFQKTIPNIPKPSTPNLFTMQHLLQCADWLSLMICMNKTTAQYNAYTLKKIKTHHYTSNISFINDSITFSIETKCHLNMKTKKIEFLLKKNVKQA